VTTYRWLAASTVAVHLGFVLFVAFGGFAVLRWPRLIWLHAPAAVWGAWISISGGVCPLTPLENWLRARGGGPIYEETFLEHYIMPLLYPTALTRTLQWGMAGVVLGANGLLYFLAWHRAHRGRRA
jgi:hypothetical protein